MGKVTARGSWAGTWEGGRKSARRGRDDHLLHPPAGERAPLRRLHRRHHQAQRAGPARTVREGPRGVPARRRSGPRADLPHEQERRGLPRVVEEGEAEQPGVGGEAASDPRVVAEAARRHEPPARHAAGPHHPALEGLHEPGAANRGHQDLLRVAPQGSAHHHGARGSHLRGAPRRSGRAGPAHEVQGHPEGALPTRPGAPDRRVPRRPRRPRRHRMARHRAGALRQAPARSSRCRSPCASRTAPWACWCARATRAATPTGRPCRRRSSTPRPGSARRAGPSDSVFPFYDALAGAPAWR